MISTQIFVLFLFALGTGAFTPFQVVDDYMKQFEHNMLLLKSSVAYDEPPTLTPTFSFLNKEDESVEPEEFDFIIVGSGAAGSVIASRLSEIPEWRVLLLEAGTAEDTATKVPAVQPYLRTSQFNWQYKTVPQNSSCLGAVEQQCAIGTGKAQGGDTVTNEMLYTRGHPKDYDTWADNNLTGWCWQSVLPYFKNIEDAFAHDLDRKQHSYGGPVHLENFQYSTPLSSHILEAAHDAGLKKIDYNGKERIGFGFPQVTTKDGKRYSAASAYLAKVYKRENLVIKLDSRVMEVIVSHHTKEAKGVKYYQGGKLHTAKAAKEVILAAGAVNTAQLLLLSGIGPKEDLEALELPVVADLKVGHNLKDHVTFMGLNFLLNNTDHNLKIHENPCHDDMMKYLKYGKGPLTTTGLELVGFVQTEVSKSKTPYPDVEFLITRNLYNQGHEQLRHLNIRDDVYNAVWAPLAGKEGFSVEVILLHPKSTGYVKIQKKDPFLFPIINPNSLTDQDEEDIETILAGIHKALELVKSEALQKYGVYLSPHRVPGCDHAAEFTDDYWKCAITHLSVNSRHLTGTAKMGPKDDKEAVVDLDLRVYGVHNLRVADSSVIPVTISGNLMAANFMIGEQAAHKIRKDWLKETCKC